MIIKIIGTIIIVIVIIVAIISVKIIIGIVIVELYLCQRVLMSQARRSSGCMMVT